MLPYIKDFFDQLGKIWISEAHSRFKDTNIRLLKKSGWHPSRKIDITEYERKLLEDGYQVPDSIRAIIREFGGLHVAFPYTHEDHEHPAFIYFLPDLGDCLLGDPINLYCKAAGVSWLTPIGLDTVGNEGIFVADTGEIFEIAEPYMEYVGPDFDTALENLLAGKGRVVKRLLPKRPENTKFDE
jgi:hypothetical protein